MLVELVKLKIVYGFPLKFHTCELNIHWSQQNQNGEKKRKLVQLKYWLFSIILKSFFARYFKLNYFVC